MSVLVELLRGNLIEKMTQFRPNLKLDLFSLSRQQLLSNKAAFELIHFMQKQEIINKRTLINSPAKKELINLL